MGEVIQICECCKRSKAGPSYVNLCDPCADAVDRDSEPTSSSTTTTSHGYVRTIFRTTGDE